MCKGKKKVNYASVALGLSVGIFNNLAGVLESIKIRPMRVLILEH